MKEASPRFALGIDIGTTKVAAAIVEVESRESVATASQPHGSDIRALPRGWSEQDVSLILEAVDSCICALPQESRSRVGGIGATGQMHGVVLWSTSRNETSSLVTWQDQRCCDDDFLQWLRQESGENGAQTGFGAVTLAWYAKYEPKLFGRFDASGTIHDLIVARATGRKEAVIDPSDAASWGFFDLRSRNWNEAAARRAGVPRDMLPSLAPSGATVGLLSQAVAARWGVPAGIPVGNALGDSQAALFGSLTDPADQIALTIGTGAQLSVVVRGLPEQLPASNEPYEYRPYVDERQIVTVASLTGGRALAALGRAIKEFGDKLGLGSEVTLDRVQTVMHESGLAAIDSDLRANPSLSGERYAPEMRGSFSNLTFDNFSVGDLTAALSRGLVEYLHGALPAGLLKGRQEVVGSGNALCRSPLLQEIVRRTFGVRLTLRDGGEATACGAALIAATCSAPS
jgi:sedoheptulokinase